MRVVFFVTWVAIALCLIHLSALVLSSRRRLATGVEPQLVATNLRWVFFVPCLDEEAVIESTLDRLLSIAGDIEVVVIDDASTDRTAELVECVAATDARVRLLRRVAPDARTGKGDALNAAFSDLVQRADPAVDHVVGVVDADGRLSPDVVAHLTPHFSDPAVGAVQIGVEMHNRDAGLLAECQHLEFQFFTDIHQKARNVLGGVGLGGNGQFCRLVALVEVGDRPWTDCLTEDLELGLSVLTAGWSTRYCDTTVVTQEAIGTLRPLVRQRSRWFQGHLQCLKWVPRVLRSRHLNLVGRLDLALHLILPVVLLAFSVVLVVGWVAAARAVLSGRAELSLVTLAVAYLFGFALAPLAAFVYWRRHHEAGLVRGLVVAHAYVAYSYLWYPAGWWALVRHVSGRGSWAKTRRSGDAQIVRLAAPPASHHTALREALPQIEFGQSDGRVRPAVWPVALAASATDASAGTRTETWPEWVWPAELDRAERQSVASGRGASAPAGGRLRLLPDGAVALETRRAHAGSNDRGPSR